MLPMLFQKIEAPVRGDNASDGGPPMSERLGGNDRMFIQEDGAKEKNLLGTGVCYCVSDCCEVVGQQATSRLSVPRLCVVQLLVHLQSQSQQGLAPRSPPS